jgi:hypothetical protein
VLNFSPWFTKKTVPNTNPAVFLEKGSQLRFLKGTGWEAEKMGKKDLREGKRVSTTSKSPSTLAY